MNQSSARVYITGMGLGPGSLAATAGPAGGSSPAGEAMSNLGGHGCAGRTPRQGEGSRGFFDEASRLLSECAAVALKEAKLSLCRPLGNDFGIAVGTTFAAVDTIMQFDTTALRSGPASVRPVMFPNTVLNAPVGRLAISFGIKGPNTTLAGGETGGIDALIYASDMLRQGRARGFLAGSVFAFSRRVAAAFSKASEGGFPREAAGLFVLECSEAAQSRQAPMLAQVVSAASLFLPRGLNKRAIALSAATEVIERASLSSWEVDAVVKSAHPWSEEGLLEQQVIDALFALRRPKPRWLETLAANCFDATSSLALAAGVVALAGRPPLRNILVSSFSRFGHAGFAMLSRPREARG